MWKEKLKKAWNENPIAVIGVGAVAVSAAAQLLNALSAAQGRRAYAKQIDYKIRTRR